ncbi:MAG: RNA 2',3'-cyclic phosphodiesterase [Planctomycetota bacterium]|jgi:2'-5' RNA ligase
MKHRIRSFVAVEISSTVRTEAAELIDRLRAAGADVRWVDPGNLHVTLKFLGDVASQEIPGVCEVVRRAVEDMAPFEFEVSGAGAFPNANRPRTVWLGVTTGHDALVELNERLALPLARIGFHRESRRYHPHLTIGRVRRGEAGLRELGDLIHEYADHKVGRTSTEQVIVFSSELEPSGPRYDALARAPLNGRA